LTIPTLSSSTIVPCLVRMFMLMPSMQPFLRSKVISTTSRYAVSQSWTRTWHAKLHVLLLQMNILRRYFSGFLPQIPHWIIMTHARSSSQLLVPGSLMGRHSQTERRTHTHLFGFMEFLSCPEFCSSDAVPDCVQKQDAGKLSWGK